MIFELTEEQVDIITDALSVYLNGCYIDMEEMKDQEHKEFYQKVLKVYQDFQKQWEKMKTITLSDEELKKLKGLLDVAITGCLDDSITEPFEDLRKEAIKQANEYKKLYNKIIKPEYTEE